MYKCIHKFKRLLSIRSAIDFILKILKYSGHYPLDNESSPRRLYFICFCFVYGVTLASEVMQFCLVFGDVDEMAQVMFISTTHLGILYKSYHVLARNSIVCKLVRNLCSSDLKLKNFRQKKIAECANDVFGKLVFLYYFLSTVALKFWWFSSLKHKVHLPLAAWYPFDITKPVLNKIAYVQQVSGAVVIAFVTQALDVVFILLLHHICVRLDCLKDEFQYVNEEAAITACREEDIDKVRHALLKNAIVRHQNLIR